MPNLTAPSESPKSPQIKFKNYKTCSKIGFYFDEHVHINTTECAQKKREAAIWIECRLPRPSLCMSLEWLFEDGACYLSDCGWIFHIPPIQFQVCHAVLHCCYRGAYHRVIFALFKSSDLLFGLKTINICLRKGDGWDGRDDQDRVENFKWLEHGVHSNQIKQIAFLTTLG